MRQRVRVAAIIRDEHHNILLLQRSKGRLNNAPVGLELPIGKINFGEQPEEAIIRTIHDYISAHVSSVSLLDVISFVHLHDNSEIINLYIIFAVSLSISKVKPNPDRYTSISWVRTDDLRYIEIDDSSKSIIDILHDKPVAQIAHHDVADEIGSDAIIFTDGGSRGNPGPSAIGYNIIKPTGEVIARGGEFIGITSSRQAEYLALKRGVEKALEFNLRSVKFKLDSLMVVNHLNGVYQVKNRDIWPLYDDIKSLLSRLDSYSIIHIKRTQNLIADAEVNKILDSSSPESVIL